MVQYYHALPPEASGDKERYIDAVCAMIPPIAREGLADAVDAFCEGIAFSPAQTARRTHPVRPQFVRGAKARPNTAP